MTTLRVFGMAALLLLASACVTNESDTLAELADEVVVPGYEAVATEAQDMRVALESLCAMPSEQTLSRARQAWRDARASWMRTEAAWFGPVMDRRSLGLIDWAPIDPERIEMMLASSRATGEEDVRNVLASSQRGLGAIEYLLFDGDALARLSAPDSPRCNYLAALGRVIQSEADAVLGEWVAGDDGKPAYSDFFTSRSRSSLLPGQAVAELVRTQVFLLRTIVDMRLASALGLGEGGPDPLAIPGGAGLNALDDLRNEILGMRDVYLGLEPDGGGISALVSPLSAETDERMRDNFAASLSAIHAVEGPLNAAVVERPKQVRAVYDSLSVLQRTLNTEVVSLLGVSVGFSDTDGDSLR